jgi:catechol 2,3-dioxygenase-like lactoylglutathione lyase family enzyme
MRIGVVEDFVDEQDQALAFYTDMLGFQVKTEGFVDDRDKALVLYTDVLGFRVTTDAPDGDGAQWLTELAPDDLDGPSSCAAGSARRPRRCRPSGARRARPRSHLPPTTRRRSHEELTRRGAVFVFEPHPMGYGGTDAVFEDGCGNLLNLHQD